MSSQKRQELIFDLGAFEVHSQQTSNLYGLVPKALALTRNNGTPLPSQEINLGRTLRYQVPLLNGIINIQDVSASLAKVPGAAEL